MIRAPAEARGHQLAARLRLRVVIGPVKQAVAIEPRVEPLPILDGESHIMMAVAEHSREVRAVGPDLSRRGVLLLLEDAAVAARA